VDTTTLLNGLRLWLSETFGIEMTTAALGAAILQILVVMACYTLATTICRLTRRRTDAFVERFDPRLRPQRVMKALRRLVLPLYAAVLLLLAGRIAGFLAFPNRIIAIAASLTLAWVAVRAAIILVRDPLLARLLAGAAFLIAALDIVGLLDLVSGALDSVAVTVGQVRVSLLTVAEVALLLTVLLWAANAAARLVQAQLARMSELTPSAQVLIAKLVRIGLVAVAVLAALDAVGINFTALAVFGGAVGLGVGFGLQKVVSNFVSGVILLLDKSIKPGDVIEVARTYGWVTSLSSRYVSVRGRDGKHYLIPNEDLMTHQVVNWSYSSSLVRVDAEFFVPYDCDLRRIRPIVVAAAQRVARVLVEPAPVCHLVAFGDSAVHFLLRFWIDDPTNGVTNIKGEVMLALWAALDAEGIRMPPPRLEVRFKPR
jgi:small-conductance mechanosensitive channel